MTDKMPSRRQMAKNLGKTIREIASDPRWVTPEEKKKRMDICNSCEHFTGSRCRKCGCFLQTKAKFKASHCPINKW